ncbi:type II toxin-antitoxin system VapC family toxin [Aliikangiella sp. IMCC44359]|uniref:type II toxin-antitoxin system VapC family toxin n=1 Tax=Aliikangiella sp. IMCC44359 TaxID=3459125 RepID=UPI00403ABC3A
MEFNPYDNFVFFDSCAFDGGGDQEEKASIEAREILHKNKKKVMLMYSVVSEIRNQNMPDWIQEIEPKSRQTVKLNLTKKERKVLREIENIITGNVKLNNRKPDCLHVFEAQKYGGCFVTSDREI